MGCAEGNHNVELWICAQLNLCLVALIGRFRVSLTAQLRRLKSELASASQRVSKYLPLTMVTRTR